MLARLELAEKSDVWSRGQFEPCEHRRRLGRYQRLARGDPHKRRVAEVAEAPTSVRGGSVDCTAGHSNRSAWTRSLGDIESRRDRGLRTAFAVAVAVIASVACLAVHRGAAGGVR